MCKKEVSVEVMAEKIREGDYNDFGKLLNLCAYIPKETFSEAQKLGYERKISFRNPLLRFFMLSIPMTKKRERVSEPSQRSA